MRILPTLLIIVLGACQPPSSETPVRSPAEIEGEVAARVEGYLQAIKDLDLEYMRGFWADVEGFTVASDGTLIVGYQPWMDQIQTLVEGVESVSYMETSNPRIFVLGPDAASYSMAYRWSMNMKDGSLLSAEGSWTYVLKRFDDGWKVVHSAGTHIYS